MTTEEALIRGFNLSVPTEERRQNRGKEEKQRKETETDERRRKQRKGDGIRGRRQKQRKGDIIRGRTLRGYTNVSKVIMKTEFHISKLNINYSSLRITT